MPTRIICAAINKVDWFALGDGSVSLERPYIKTTFTSQCACSGDYHAAPQIQCATFNDCNLMTVTLDALNIMA